MTYAILLNCHEASTGKKSQEVFVFIVMSQTSTIVTEDQHDKIRDFTFVGSSNGLSTLVSGKV